MKRISLNKIFLVSFSLIFILIFTPRPFVFGYERPIVDDGYNYEDWDPAPPGTFDNILNFGAYLKTVDFWDITESYWVNVSFKVKQPYDENWRNDYNRLNITSVTLKQIGSSTIEHEHTNVGFLYWWYTETVFQENFSITYQEGDGLQFSVDVDYDLITSGDVHYSYTKTDVCTVTVNPNGPANFTISTPSSSTNWNSGEGHKIYWTTEGLVDNVDIDLYKGGTYVDNIASNVPDTGRYPDPIGEYWYVSMDYVTGSDYYINISNVDDPLSWSKSDDFSITQAKTIEVTNPTFNVHWKRGDTYDITWTWTGVITNVDIKLIDGITPVYDIADDVANDGTFEWNIPLSIDLDMYSIRVYDGSDNGIYDGSSAFYIDAQDEIYFTAPTSGSEWTAGVLNWIHWHATGDFSTLSMDLYDNGVLVENVFDSVSVAHGNNQISWACHGSRSGDNFKFKLYDPSDATFYAWSEQFSYIAGDYLELTSPTSSNSWKLGTYHNITWNEYGDYDYI
ncbi:MAG: hypothetical protein GF364_02075, partial [Candidatus Lokiarchaeota archaeon]|nr:hypothetical protein [Candidatus Lokiarchaeota archaeon]